MVAMENRDIVSAIINGASNMMIIRFSIFNFQVPFWHCPGFYITKGTEARNVQEFIYYE